MEPTADILVNLVFAIGAALLGGVIAARLGQSVILGYIFGGILIGPFTPGFVGDITAVEGLADIGIILLMFAIGVQLSIRDLLQAGRVAIIGGSIQILATIGIAYLIGIALGWGSVESLFFGAFISNSSSTVLSKILDDRGEAGSEHARISIAWSTVQDLSTIILVVVLGAIAVGEDRVFRDLLWALGRALLFLALLVPVGFKVVPLVFERIAALRNREVFVLTVGAVALGTAFISAQFGLSVALGAFMAGIVVSESDLSHQILGEVLPLRDIFAGIFFVSVGMLIDPGFVIQNLLLVLLTVVLIVIGKGLLIATITALFQYPFRVAALTGVTLAQSAEFSFLLARLGADLNAISPDVFSLMLAGAAISIIISPSLHRLAGPSVRWLDRRLPAGSHAIDPALRNPDRGLRRHAVICGYGRVGRVIGEALLRRNFPFMVIEQDPRVVRELRSQGIIALQGSADNPILLDQVDLERARLLVLAIPDALATRQAVDHALRINPELHIVVRTHNEEERQFLSTRGVDEAVMGELELALEMTRYTLHRFGVSATETQGFLQRLRMRQRDDRGDAHGGGRDRRWDD